MPIPKPVSPEQRAAVDLKRLAPLVVQFALLLLVYYAFNTESARFFRLACFTLGAFLIHYFTPFRFKQWVFVGLSLLGAVWVLIEPSRVFLPKAYAAPVALVGSTVIAGLVFYALTHAPVSRLWRVLLVVAFGAVLWVWRHELWFGVPDSWFKYIGAIFMFRGILYVYEMYQSQGKVTSSFKDFVTYFFMLPNYYFLLFPVVDYQTFRKGYFAEDIHTCAQRGISWLVRGAVHLALYRLLYHRLPIGPDEVDSIGSLIRYVFPTFLMYLQVSGQFHTAVGMLLLFGYRLPETNNNFLLASSFTDFWRRINIYWKDFMVKVFYYPAYFRLRKKGETLALTLATIYVFFITTILHAYQLYWLQGRFDIPITDVAFWTILGMLVLVNVLMEQRARKAKKEPTAADRVFVVLRIIGVYVTISVLWSMWSAPSLAQWWDAVTYWN